ncbi:hypothetical protein ACGFIK_08990 [Micromonospora sp. NPDC048871]|uniref:hypothetical protein n=1 Tax=unclassified Micromonospora TaxID=2617518 RepID=UPI002E11877E|nr:hypothetical protein OIE53_21000 [Micromonospora sp. NBC_01739]
MTLSEKAVSREAGRLAPRDGDRGPRPTTFRLRSLGRHLAALGPFALFFGTYSLLLDHLPDHWFEAEWLRILFAVLTGLCVGMALRWFVQTPFMSRVLTPPNAVTATAPALRRQKSGAVPSARQIFDGTRDRLLSDLRTSAGSEGRELYGWSQFIGDKVPPSAIGTSYGLRIALTLDIQDARLDRRKLVENIVALQRPAGGWVARSQRDVARPEVTSWVLTALVRAGLDPAFRTEIVGQLERMMSADVDPVGWESVSVLSSAIAALAEVQPQSAKLGELVSHLLDGAMPQDAGNGSVRLGWGRTVRRGEWLSVPHTARAVVALHKASQVLKQGVGQLNDAVDAGIECLSHNPDLSLGDEQLRRRVGDASDTIMIGHFTPAWVARALMCRNTPARLPQLRQAVREVLAHQENGVWKWKDRMEPTWMTYQGVLVIRDYSMLNHPWPA